MLHIWEGARQALSAQNRDAKGKDSELPFLKQSLKLKKKEIKLTKQKLQTLEAQVEKYEKAFAKLRTIVQNDL